MRKTLALLCLAAAAALMPGSAFASPVFDVGYTSAAPRGVVCSTGTAAQVNVTRPLGMTGVPAAYRIQNQDSTNAVWIGGVSDSTTADIYTASDLRNLGEKLTAGSDGVYPVGRDPGNNAASVPIYCKAANAATGGVLLSVYWFMFGT